MIYRSQLRFLLEGVEGIVVLLLVFVTWPLSRRRLEQWGSTAAERERAWPGDAFVASSCQIYTRAVSIAATAEAVWPWVVQFGLDRAGFYSYELLERAVGIPVRNAESIVPAFQELEVGDEIKLHPEAAGIRVGALEPGRQLCFGEPDDDPLAVRSDPRRSWSIYLEQTSSNACRLVLRSCVESVSEPKMRARVVHGLERPIDFVMEQRMLRTLRRLAESGSQTHPSASERAPKPLPTSGPRCA